MSRPPREPGILRIGEPVRRRIARLRYLDPRSGPTTIDVAKVREIEATLACTFDDEVLAMMASGVGDLVQDACMDVSQVIERTRAAWIRGCPDDLIAIGGHPSGLDYYCVERTSSDEKAPLLVAEFVCADRSLTGQPIVEWLDARLELRREVLVTGDKNERKLAAKLPTKAEIDLFQPSLVVVEITEPKVRKVRHATFGVGEVLEEIQAGAIKKLNVQFAVGKKLLVSTVLEDVEG